MDFEAKDCLQPVLGCSFKQVRNVYISWIIWDRVMECRWHHHRGFLLYGHAVPVDFLSSPTWKSSWRFWYKVWLLFSSFDQKWIVLTNYQNLSVQSVFWLKLEKSSQTLYHNLHELLHVEVTGQEIPINCVPMWGKSSMMSPTFQSSCPK
jgi:hypothetical protein